MLRYLKKGLVREVFKLIRAYYEKTGIPAILVNKKMELFEKHQDIASEFEYWLQNKSYSKDNCVMVENYTAEKLAKLSDLLDGEGAFSLLVQLREDPKKALKRIEAGFIIR